MQYAGGMDDETSALVDLLRTSRRPSLRQEAARQLAAKLDPNLAPFLLEALDPSSDALVIPVVTVAITGLQALGDAIAPEVTAILDGPPDRRRVFMPLLLA